MPSIDRRTGKPVGGAAKDRVRRAKVEAQRKREEKRKKGGAVVGLQFEALPPPPLGDPLAAMCWWNDVLLTCADKVLRDPVMPLEDRVKFLADFSAKAGYIRDKAGEAKALREAVKAKVKVAEDKGLERGGSPPTAVPRPPG